MIIINVKFEESMEKQKKSRSFIVKIVKTN